MMLTFLFSLFYVTGEFHKFLDRGRAKIAEQDYVTQHSIFKYTNESAVVSYTYGWYIFHLAMTHTTSERNWLHGS